MRAATFKSEVRSVGAETFIRYSIPTKRLLKEFGEKIGARMREVGSLNRAVRECADLVRIIQFPVKKGGLL